MLMLMLVNTSYPAHPTLRMHLLAPDPPFSPNPTGKLDPASPQDSCSRPAKSRGLLFDLELCGSSTAMSSSRWRCCGR